MTNSTQDQNDDESTETQELTIHIIDKFLRMFFVVGVICVIVVAIALVAALVFVEDPYIMDTCPDYPVCSLE